PEQVAVFVDTGEVGGGEQGVDALAVRYRRRGGHARLRMAARVPGGPQLPLPQLLARADMEGQNEPDGLLRAGPRGSVKPATRERASRPSNGCFPSRSK